MSVKQVTLEEATTIFRDCGIEVIIWMTGSMQVVGFDGMICDYSNMAAYTVKYACEIRNIKTGEQVERFNVMQ